MWRETTGGRTTKIVSLSLFPSMLKEIEKVAKKEKRTKSELIRDAIRLYMEEREWRNILRYGRKQTARLGIREDDVNRLVHEFREEEKNP